MCLSSMWHARCSCRRQHMQEPGFTTLAQRRSSQDQEDLESLRRRIDSIDNQIVDLLDERASIVRGVLLAKQARGMALHDPAREDALIERLCTRARRFPAQKVAVIYTEIMAACLKLQREWSSS
jgi:chorismate mutase